MKKLIPMALSLLLIALLTGYDRADYKKAVSFYESGKYEEAAEILEALGEYEDAPAMVTACNYQIALDLVNQGNYQEVRTIFLSLGDYEDSVQQSVSCACQLAKAYAQDGKLTELSFKKGENCTLTKLSVRLPAWLADAPMEVTL